MAAPTRLSGVEAPDVRPIAMGPAGGSQPRLVTSVLDPTGRCRISSDEVRQSGSAMWNVGREAWQRRAGVAVLLLLEPPVTIIKATRLSRRSRAIASLRYLGALAKVSDA